ncbi:MAG: Clp protease N-terminal domain-containing protein [Acidimicrobiales bacterium]
MFERFTDRARRVVVLAQEESRLLNHNYIGTEHLLLALIHEGEGVAAKALENLGITHEAVKADVMKIVGQGAGSASGHIPFTPRAKKVLEFSLREALQLGHNYIGTEHLLLGMLREGEGIAAQVLKQLGGDLSAVRHEVVQVLSGYSRSAPSATPPSDPAHPGHTPAGRRTATQARRLAGPEAVGSQHYLLAALDDESSLAARALAALGISREQVEEALRSTERAGTSDELPEEAGARTLRLVTDARGVRLEIEDPELLAILVPLVDGGLVPASLPGGEPLAASFQQLWRAVSDAIHDVGVRGAAAAEPDQPSALGGEE